MQKHEGLMSAQDVIKKHQIIYCEKSLISHLSSTRDDRSANRMKCRNLIVCLDNCGLSSNYWSHRWRCSSNNLRCCWPNCGLPDPRRARLNHSDLSLPYASSWHDCLTEWTYLSLQRVERLEVVISIRLNKGKSFDKHFFNVFIDTREHSFMFLENFPNIDKWMHGKEKNVKKISLEFVLILLRRKMQHWRSVD